MKAINLLAALLLLGVVDQINGDSITVEYEEDGYLTYSTVSLNHSACTPREGQKVYFFKDYKIVSCEDEI